MADLKSLPAHQVMSTDLLVLREDMPVEEALSTMEDYEISGAPVVDALGQCVGVFTRADVVKRDVSLKEGDTPRAGEYFASDPFEEGVDYFAKEDYDDRVLGRDTVGQWMSTDVQSVSPETPLGEVCRKMADGRIHRVLVLEGRRPRGIITSIDVVRVLAGVGAAKRRAAPAVRRRPGTRARAGRAKGRKKPR
jgi:CBS domain-containing protein